MPVDPAKKKTKSAEAQGETLGARQKQEQTPVGVMLSLVQEMIVE